jgi:TonB family protein
MDARAIQRLLVIPAWLIVATGFGVAGASAQDPIGAAKDLYASAAYEEALSALTSVTEHSAPDVVHQADQYRAFCLLALGRNAEAESAAESAIRHDPLAELDQQDASPRIEAMFTLVRKRLLPGLIRDAYRTARAATEKGDLAGGVQQLTAVRSMLDQAKHLNAWDEALDDINLLVDGFLELSRIPAERGPAVVPLSQQPAAEAPGPGPGTDHPEGNASVIRSYSILDADVTAPVVVRQEIPVVPRSLASMMDSGRKKSGTLEITIDEAGAVQHAFMREPVNAMFDAWVIEAARSWQYRPARREGVPVRYVLRIRVSVQNQN